MRDYVMKGLFTLGLVLSSSVLLLANALPENSSLQGDAFPAPPRPVEPKPAAPTQVVPSPTLVEPSEDVAGEAGEVAAADLAPAIPRFSGEWQEGYDELRQAHEAGDLTKAIELAGALAQPSLLQQLRESTLAGEENWRRSAVRAADPLLEALGLLQPIDFERAEIRFAHGFLQAELARELLKDAEEGAGEAALEATQTARFDFAASRALAGPGELRRDATYSQSRVLAERAEEARLGIPEIREKLGLPALPPPPPPPADAEEEPDPDADLKALRGLYLEAREPLLERVLLGAYEDSDVQANLELIQRRLRELASIERQREEEEQQQEESSDSEDNEESDQEQEGENKSEDSEEEGEEGEKQESDSADSESQPEEPKDENAESEEEQKPEEGETPEGEPEPTDEAPENAERYLTREETMRLLEKLKQIEKEGESVRRQVRSGQRTPGKRDW